MNAIVEALDTTRRKGAYDGLEPHDGETKISLPMGRPDFAFTFNEFERQPFINLKAKLGDAAFDKIVETQGYKIPKGEFEVFVGEDDLQLYYFIRPDDKADAVKLVLVSFGEFQPARYMVHIEGIWRVTGVNF